MKTASYSAKDNMDEKQKALSIIHQLTLLSPSLEYLEKPIILSNEYIASKTDEISKLQGMKPIVVRVYAYMFRLQRDHIYDELTKFVICIEAAIKKGNQLIQDLNLCVSQLASYTQNIEDQNSKQDFMGIVSVNKLKIATIEQSITQCKQQIDRIDKFRTVTLHHINDTVLLNNSNNSDRNEYNEIQSIFSTHIKTESLIKKYMSISTFALSALAILNYLAATYHLRWNSTLYKEVPITVESNSMSLASSLDNFISDFFGFLSILGPVIGLPLFLLGIFSFIKGEAKIHLLTLGMVVITAPAIVSVFFKNTIPTTKEVPYLATTTVDFFNFGSTGSLVMILLALLCFASIYAFKAISKPMYDAIDIFKKLPEPSSDSISKQTS